MHGDHSIADAYRRHAPAVFRRARQILGTEAEARDIVQDVFLSLFENTRQFQGKSSLTAFLYSVTTHACLNRVRDQKNRARLEREHFAGAGPDERDSRLTPEQLAILHRTLQRMPDELATVAVYYLVDGLTHQEIARLLDCSRRHVGHLLERVEHWQEAQARAEAESC
ncbi:MAG TPA: sigma-70 family RNA polymerase sigma factor [Polyangiaceae bacterium]